MRFRLPFSPRILSLTALAAVLGTGALGSAAPARGVSASAASSAGAAPACAPRAVDRSQAVAGKALTVSPAPYSLDASHLTQISFLGAPAADLAAISVLGSRTGRHAGRLAAYSQGDGASFLPSKPFAEGELVSVRGILRMNGSETPFAWHFTVAKVDSTSRSLETPPAPLPRSVPSEYEQLVSSPLMRPPAVAVTTNTGAQEADDLFLAPYAGSGQYGPMILNSAGRLIWFDPIPPGARAADLRVQRYEGQQVLTWWQDPLIAEGQSDSGIVIDNSAYQTIQYVRGGNGYQPDLHAFEITPQGTALFTVYDAIRCNLSAYGGPANGAIADTLFQEIDLKTGLVRFEWHSIDHVPLSDSYEPIRPGGTPDSPWDDFHINAISEHGADFLVDSRNTWTAYWINALTGQVVWRLGGKRSSFRMGPEASPAWQHDARVDPGGTFSFFDNGGTPAVHSQSRGLVIATNMQNMTATLVHSYPHPAPPLLASSQGDFQPLANGDWLAGWGEQPYFTEYAPGGQVVFDAHLPARYQTYTVLKFPWSGNPAQQPKLAVRVGPSRLTAYVSWNGSTELTSWRVLGGPSPHALVSLGTVAPNGFETPIGIPGQPAYLAVQALGAAGQVLRTSPTVKA